jgi:hypothetical protein
MIQWYEGEIIAYTTPIFGQQPRATVQELSQGIEIQNVQMPVVNGQQIRPPSQADTGGRGTRIAFYRDSAATAKFGFIISDPLPLHTPIVIDTASLEASQNAPCFAPGEVAFAAQGVSTDTQINDGGMLWLRNSGDAALISGSFTQRIYASDSSNSIDIEGTNVDIYSHGNLIATHFFGIKDDFGVTSLSLGMRNPISGVGYTTLECAADGAFSIGDSLGLSGIEYNLVASLPFVTNVPQITLTSIPLISYLVVNTEGTLIFGPKIGLAGTTEITGDTTIIGKVDITGDTSIVGATSIEGDTSIIGDTTVEGLFGVIGLGISVNDIPGVSGTFILPTSITVVGGIVTAVS